MPLTRCPGEGLLQAYLDDELDAAQAAQVAGHLTQCQACQAQLSHLEQLASLVASPLDRYRQDLEVAGRITPGLDNRKAPPVAPMPMAQPLTTYASIRERMGTLMRKHKWLAGTALAALALALFLGWAPGRSLAAQFLNLFRMEKIQVVKITPGDMAELEKLMAGQSGQADIKNFGQVEVTAPKESTVTVKPAEVEGLTGLKLDLPSSLAGRKRGSIQVQQNPTIAITPDVEKLNSYLKKHGGTLLPEGLAGKTFTIKIPPLVKADYQGQGGAFTLYAAPDLTIDVPAGVDMMALRRALLDLPFLPANIRQQLAAITDWQHTLPIPETEGMRPREITVNGDQGVYFADNQGSGVLAWRQGNSWRAISGLSLQDALKVAAEVK